MLASTLLSVLPVLALAAPAFASPVVKKRACARPSASVSASMSASASMAVSSAIESASASAVETTSINTGVFAPEQTESASLEPTSTIASDSASASEVASSTSASAEPAQSSAASSSDADLFVQLHNDFRAQYGMSFALLCSNKADDKVPDLLNGTRDLLPMQGITHLFAS